MLFVGITGGVGAGKSEILNYLGRHHGTRVMLADEIAHELMEPGTECFEKLAELFRNEDIFQKDGHFDRKKLASVIFADEEKRNLLNGIVHPAVKDYVCEQVQAEREGGVRKLLVLEAALLIEEHYDEICDELWYIYTDREIRRERLKISRGYSDTKIDQIFDSQLSEDEYRKNCQLIINNDGRIEQTLAQIDKALRERHI